MNIPIKDIHLALDKYNYRVMSEDEYDEQDEKITELKDSIAEQGLINPITVIKDKEGYEVIAGHRRYIACKSLGMTEIQCNVFKKNELDAYAIGLCENLQRSNMKPLEEAIGIKKFADKFGLKSYSEIGKKVGKQTWFVKSRLALLELPQKVQNAINNKEVAILHIEQIFDKIVNDKLRDELINFIILKRNLNDTEINTLIKMAYGYQQSYKFAEEQVKTESEVRKSDLSFQKMMKEHDVQFVDGYLRLDPSTFDERGEYSYTTKVCQLSSYEQQLKDTYETKKSIESIAKINSRKEYVGSMVSIVSIMFTMLLFISRKGGFVTASMLHTEYSNMIESHLTQKYHTNYLRNKKNGIRAIIEYFTENGLLESQKGFHFAITEKGKQALEHFKILSELLGIEAS